MVGGEAAGEADTPELHLSPLHIELDPEMVAELVATQREKAAVSPREVEELENRSEHQIHLI